MGVALEDVVFEEAILNSTIWEGHNAAPVLDAFFPLTLVDGAIGPVHLSISLTLIVHVVSVVDVAAFPGELSLPVLFIVTVHALKSIAL